MKISVVLFLLLLPALCLAEGKMEIRARVFQPGEVILVTVKEILNPTGEFLGQKLLFHENSMALAPIDLDVKPGTFPLVVQSGDGKIKIQKSVKVLEKKFPTRNLPVDPKYVEPSAADLARADKETAQILAAYAQRSEPLRLNANLEVPVSAKTGSRFGEKSFFNGQERKPHSGIDLEAEKGDPVHASADGKVVLTGDFFFPGLTVILDHGLGIFTAYMHLSEIGVKESQLVKRGEVVGKAGATGRVTGPHLHWVLRVLGKRVDPFSLVELKVGEVLEP